VHGIKGTRVYSLSSDLDHPESYINLELGKGSKFQTRNQDIICTKKALNAGLTVYSTSKDLCTGYRSDQDLPNKNSCCKTDMEHLQDWQIPSGQYSQNGN
jgi:hypothetical protein